MTNSYSFTNGSTSPSYLIKSFITTTTTILETENSTDLLYSLPEQEQSNNENASSAAASAADAKSEANSFYGSPLSYKDAPSTEDKQEDNLNTTPTAIGNHSGAGSTDDDSPAVTSKELHTLCSSKNETATYSAEEQISSLSSSSSPDSRNMNQDETSESQILVTASEGEMSFGNEPNVENTITMAADASLNNEHLEHEHLTNLVMNNKVLDINELISQQNQTMNDLMGKKPATTTTTTTTVAENEQINDTPVAVAVANDVEEKTSDEFKTGIVNYTNANNDELDGHYFKFKAGEAENKESKDKHHKHEEKEDMSFSSSSSSSSTSESDSSSSTSSPQSSVEPSSSSSSSFNKQSEENADVVVNLESDLVKMNLEIKFDDNESKKEEEEEKKHEEEKEKEEEKKAEEEKEVPSEPLIEREITNDDFKSETISLTNSNYQDQCNMEANYSTKGNYPSSINTCESKQEEEEVTCLVNKIVSDVITQAVQIAPMQEKQEEREQLVNETATKPAEAETAAEAAPMAMDEIEAEFNELDKFLANNEEKLIDDKSLNNILAAFDNDHGSYYRNQEEQQLAAKTPVIEQNSTNLDEIVKVQNVSMSQRESIQNLKNIDEDEDEESQQVKVGQQNVSFGRKSNEKEEDLLNNDSGNLNNQNGEVDLAKMEALNSTLNKTGSASGSLNETNKIKEKHKGAKSHKPQEPVVDCFSCTIV